MTRFLQLSSCRQYNNPKAEFFLALADFNHYVARQDFRTLINTRIKDKLINARALVNDEGQLFSGADLWSLFAGLIEQPAWLDEPDKLTQDIVDEWTAIHRDNFRQLCLKHLVSRAEAWEVLEAKITEVIHRDGPAVSPDDMQWIKEMISGYRDPLVDEASRMAMRFVDQGPLPQAWIELLGSDSKKVERAIEIARLSAQLAKPFIAVTD